MLKLNLNNYHGPLAVLIICLLIETLKPTGFGIPNPPAFLLLAIVYSAFVGGFKSGVISAVFGWIYIAYFFSLPNLPFQYTNENLRRVGVWAFTIPLIAVMVGILKRRSVQAVLLQLQEKERAGEELSQLYRELEVRGKERTKDLLRTETELRLITNALPVGITYIDNELKYKFCNDTFCKWYEKTNRQINGSSVKDILGEADFTRVLPFLSKSILGQAVSAELQMDNIVESSMIDLKTIPDFDEHGSVRGVVCLTTDITAQKRIERQLKLAKESSDTANEAKSAFLANMSHEIRTPLGAVIGFSELLADEKLGLSKKANFVLAIKRNGALLSNIISDILDISKVEAGKMVADIRETTLEEILADTQTLLGLQSREKGIAFNLIVGETVPSIIRTDPLRLRQILINIIGNAIKFTERGSITLSVNLKTTTSGSPCLAFSVTDTGHGIATDQIGKLFALFSQADYTAKRKYGGSGLGLVLSRRLANLLGGDVVLTATEIGKGSTFTITIDPGPLHKGLYKDGIKVNVSPTKTESDDRLKGLEILLAEDSLDNQILVSHILKLAGAKIEIAQNGKEAVEKALAHSYNVVLMDLQMPVMDGFEATAELRNQRYQGKIFALTAHALADDKQRCLQSGFDGHLSKPINRNALIHELSLLSQQPNI